MNEQMGKNALKNQPLNLDELELELIAGGLNKNLSKKLAFPLALILLGSQGNISTKAGSPTELSKTCTKGTVDESLDIDDPKTKMALIKLLTDDHSNMSQNDITELLKFIKSHTVSLMSTMGILFAINNASETFEKLRNLYMIGSNALKNVFYKWSRKGIDTSKYEVILQRIEKRLRAELVGQDQAINKIIEIMTGYFESILEAKSLNKKFEGGLLLYLNGNPATGKSTTMKIIEEEMGLSSYVGRMSDAVEDVGNGAHTVASRLTKPIVKNTGTTRVIVDTPLTKQINVGVPTLYCLDEVDKMRNLDSTLQKRKPINDNGQIVGGSIDELLRNFGDTGHINGKDVSGSILIATSNETPEELAKLEPSLYNRYKGCAVQFKAFEAKDYVEIINRKTKSIQEFYKGHYNVNVLWDKSALDHYSEQYEKEKSGGRGVETLMNAVRFALKNYSNQNEQLKDRDVSLNYDATTDKLYVKSDL